MQHLAVKIFAQPGAKLDASNAIAMFHRWIQHRDLPELLIDVADYAHLPEGPGVVLMGHEAAYSLDTSRGRLGLLYSRREPVDLDGPASLRHAYDSALRAAHRVENEPEFQGRLRFNPNDFEVIWNDRLLHPNTTESWEKVRPVLDAFLHELGRDFRITRHADPRDRLRIEAVAA